MLTYSVTFTSVENTQINLTAQILCKNNAEDQNMTEEHHLRKAEAATTCE